MPRPVSIVLTLVFLIVANFSTLALPAACQEKLVRSLYVSGLQDYELGNYKEALKKLRKAMALSEGVKFNSFERSQGLLTLAETLRSLGHYEEAEKTFNESIKYANQAGFRKNITLSRVYNNLGVLYFENSDFPKAEAAWKESEKISFDIKYLPTNNLARLYLKWGKLAEAEEYLAKAKKFATGLLNNKDITQPYYYYNLATYNKLKGKFDEAEQNYKKAIAGIQKLVTENHLYYTIVLMGLSELYIDQSRFEEAEKEIRTIVKTRENALGDENPLVAEAYVLLANVLADEGKYNEAREFAGKAIELNNRIFEGGDNLFVAKAKHAFANIRRQEGQYAEAEKLLNESLSTVKRILGADHLEVADIERDLGSLKLDQLQYREAETLFQSASNIVESRTGPDHPERAELALDLGNLYLREGLYDKAEIQFLKSVKLSKEVLGETSRATASSARKLGELYVKLGKSDDAISQLTAACNIDKSIFGEASPPVAADLMALAGAYDSAGQSEKSKDLLAQANQIKQKFSGGGANVNSPQLTIPVAFSSKDDRPVRDKWALVIGISNFKDPSINLKFAAKDATDFGNFLVTSEKFKEDHVKTLTDQEATRENIVAMLGEKWLGKNAREDDLIVVYVSSHGSHSQEDAGGVNFLVAHDTDKNSLLATGIPMQWLSKMISEQVKSNRVVLILDVCHSGAAAQGGKSLNRIAGLAPDVFKIGSGQMVLCSSMAEQVSWESKEYENSVFTRRLIEALRVNNDKTTLLDAYNRLKVLVESEVLRDRSNLQTPVLWNEKWVGKDPMLAVDTATVTSH
ncbi:tetratricopeptide repeat protein [Candidatus Obscuribacterales bacterium]|nr:tetratricopeptide repeat protein [Candidatus Obscuribacterales bacterium]MBX3151426.1 tetratricopeptide repeat protein [Candidatus Obscuribacterales bacterium]